MSSFFNLGKKAVSGVGQAIKSIKTNVPKTELQKKTRDLKIATQKNKASKAKLDQSIFEFKRNEKFTFPSNTKKSESNKESYKRIQKENSKVIKSMLDKATEKKADGGRIGLKHGSYETVPPSQGFNEYVTKEKQRKIDEANKKANEKDKSGAGPQEQRRAGARAPAKVGGRMGRKFGSPNPRKSNVQKIKETFGSKKNVPSKLKGFSKLPEAVQQQMNKKLAKKV